MVSSIITTNMYVTFPGSLEWQTIFLLGNKSESNFIQVTHADSFSNNKRGTAIKKNTWWRQAYKRKRHVYMLHSIASVRYKSYLNREIVWDVVCVVLLLLLVRVLGSWDRGNGRFTYSPNATARNCVGAIRYLRSVSMEMWPELCVLCYIL
jgi:hypothetical protein